MNLQILRLTTLLGLIVAAGPSHAAIVFSEDFGTIADGDEVTTSNTNFDYRRIGSGGGGITAIAPSSFSGSSMSLGGSSNGSLNGVGLTTGLGNLNLLSMEFDFRTADPTLGDLVFTSGQGSSFTGNGGFSTSQLFFGLQIDAGNLEYRTSEWNNTGITVAADTNYSIAIFANNSGSTVSHALGSVATGTMDIVLDGVVIADDVAFANNVAADAFRLYQVNGGQTYEIDNILLQDSFTAVPEPTSALIMVGIVGSLALRRRRS